MWSNTELSLNTILSDQHVHNVNKKGQLSLTNPRDPCETFAQFM